MYKLLLMHRESFNLTTYINPYLQPTLHCGRGILNLCIRLQRPGSELLPD